MPKIKGGARRGSPKGTLIYIQKDMSAGEYGVHNLLNKADDIEGLTLEFKELNSGRGVRSYYHEFVSFSPQDRERCMPDLMREFAEGYIERNYNNQQVVWAVHRQNKGEPVRHPHVHFCISATGLDGKKLHRTIDDMLERDRFTQAFAKERGFDYLKGLSREKELRRGPSIEKRDQYCNRMDMEGRPVGNIRETLRREIKGILRGPELKTKEAFKKALEKRGIGISKRETGVEYENRTYRFKGIGYEKDLYQKEGFKAHQREFQEGLQEKLQEKLRLEKAPSQCEGHHLELELRMGRDMGRRMSMGM